MVSMNALGILGILIGGALAVRPKRGRSAASFLMGGRGSLLNTSTIATIAAGTLAAQELWKGSRGPRSTTVAPEIPAAPVRSETRAPSGSPERAPAASGASAPVQLSPEMLRLVRLTVAATMCDGALSARESERLIADAKSAKVESLVRAELQRPRPIAEIVAGASAAHARDLYALAFAVVRADEGVLPAERAWLDDLAGALRLEPPQVEAIEREIETRIDSAR